MKPHPYETGFSPGREPGFTFAWTPVVVFNSMTFY
jgi:hypothetical protein